MELMLQQLLDKQEAQSAAMEARLLAIETARTADAAAARPCSERRAALRTQGGELPPRRIARAATSGPPRAASAEC
jgi:hypothetical protein